MIGWPALFLEFDILQYSARRFTVTSIWKEELSMDSFESTNLSVLKSCGAIASSRCQRALCAFLRRTRVSAFSMLLFVLDLQPFSEYLIESESRVLLIGSCWPPNLRRTSQYLRISARNDFSRRQQPFPSRCK